MRDTLTAVVTAVWIIGGLVATVRLIADVMRGK